MDELIDGLELSPRRKFLTIYLWIDKDTNFLQANFFYLFIYGSTKTDTL